MGTVDVKLDKDFSVILISRYQPKRLHSAARSAAEHPPASRLTSLVTSNAFPLHSGRRLR